METKRPVLHQHRPCASVTWLLPPSRDTLREVTVWDECLRAHSGKLLLVGRFGLREQWLPSIHQMQTNVADVSSTRVCQDNSANISATPHCHEASKPVCCAGMRE